MKVTQRNLRRKVAALRFTFLYEQLLRRCGKVGAYNAETLRLPQVRRARAEFAVRAMATAVDTVSGR